MDLSPDVLSHHIECQACLLGCQYCLVLAVNQVNLQGKVYAPGDATSGVRKTSERRLQSFCEASTRLLHGRKIQNMVCSSGKSTQIQGHSRNVLHKLRIHSGMGEAHERLPLIEIEKRWSSSPNKGGSLEGKEDGAAVAIYQY